MRNPTDQIAANGTRHGARNRKGRRLLFGIVGLAVAASVLAISSPALADHECDGDDDPCRVIYHGFSSRDRFDWTPHLYDEVGDDSWYSRQAPNTLRYDYTYATGGRLLDNYAVWTFGGAASPIRGVFRIFVRIPEGPSLSRPATASVLYDVYVRENGRYHHATSFVIDQKRQKGWVDVKRMLVLRSAERVIRSLFRTKRPGQTSDQVGYANSRMTVDAIKLDHFRFLPEDRSYAQMQCAARTPEGREIDLMKEIDHITPTNYGSFAVSATAGVLSLIPAVATNPIGAGALLGVTLADPIARLIFGQGLFEALAAEAATARALDIQSVINGSKFGGRWSRPDTLFSKNRYFEFDDPGPCELFGTWSRYLPRGA